MAWRPTAESKIERFERIQRRAVKWILDEQDHHYDDWEHTRRLKDLGILPLKYFFAYFVRLLEYFRSYDNNDKSRLRSNVAPPDYHNNQMEILTIGLASMRAVSHDNKSLKCTLSKTSPIVKK